MDLYHNELRLIGLDTLKRDLDASARILRNLASGLQTGACQPHTICHLFSLHDARLAYEHVLNGSSGRVVLNMAGA